MEFVPVWVFFRFRTQCFPSCNLRVFYREADTKDNSPAKNTLKGAECCARVVAVADNQREVAFKWLNGGMFC